MKEGAVISSEKALWFASKSLFSSQDKHHDLLFYLKKVIWFKGMSSPSIVISETIKIIQLLKPLLPVSSRRIRFPRLTKQRMGLLKSVMIFGTGFYAGVYVSQNYDLSKFDDPTTLADKVLSGINEFLEQYRKKWYWLYFVINLQYIFLSVKIFMPLYCLIMSSFYCLHGLDCHL